MIFILVKFVQATYTLITGSGCVPTRRSRWYRCDVRGCITRRSTDTTCHTRTDLTTPTCTTYTDTARRSSHTSTCTSKYALTLRFLSFTFEKTGLWLNRFLSFTFEKTELWLNRFLSFTFEMTELLTQPISIIYVWDNGTFPFKTTQEVQTDSDTKRNSTQWCTRQQSSTVY